MRELSVREVAIMSRGKTPHRIKSMRRDVDAK
jgi:hypothetical protein